MRIAMDRLPLEVSVGDARVRRGAWTDRVVRVLDLPPDTQIGCAGAETPDVLCRSSHWGYVLEGSIEVRFAFGERESARAGDIYYWPALHTCWTDEGVRCLEFSPAEDTDRPGARVPVRRGA
jgi:hypothetical protein